MKKISSELSNRILNATNTAEVDAWAADVEREIGGVSWLPVGKTENNSGFCEFSTDSGFALVERITNCQDALLEMMARVTGQEPQSPHEAARLWFPTAEQDADAEKAGKNAKSRKLEVARKIVVGMRDGDSHRLPDGKTLDLPTISIRDHGIGQHPDDFAGTLLSFGRKNKLHKPYLHGKYNMGSNVSYRFSSRTIIISRRDARLLGGKEDEVGATVVLRNDDLPEGPYVYMADAEGNTIRLDLPELESGTEIRLVGYNIPHYNNRVNLPTNSLWQLFHSSIVSPAIPFSVQELRPKHFVEKGRKPGPRTINGLVSQLRGKLSSKKNRDEDGSDEEGQAGSEPVCVYTHTSRIEVCDGDEIEVHTFVLNEKARQNEYYVKADNHLIFSLNGQRQMSKERTWFEQAGFPALYKRIIVVADCTSLSAKSRREVFSSTRENGVNSPLTKEILERIKEELKDDQILKSLEDEAREKASGNATRKSSEAAEKELLKQISGMAGIGELLSDEGGDETRREKKTPDDSHLPETPTRLKIENPPVLAHPGRKARVSLLIDAKNGYFPGSLKTVQAVSPTLGGLKIASIGSLVGGNLRISIEIPANASIGTHDLTVALNDLNTNIVISDKAAMEVSTHTPAPPRDQKKKEQRGSGCEIEIKWLGKDEWESLEWDKSTVGDCLPYMENPRHPDKITKVVFRLNEHNERLQDLLKKKRATEGTVRSILHRYSVAVCRAILSMKLETGDPRTEQQREREKDRIAVAIIQTMHSQFFAPVDFQDEDRQDPSIGETPSPDTTRAERLLQDRPSTPSPDLKAKAKRQEAAEFAAVADFRAGRP